jgi:hypothetical protein
MDESDTRDQPTFPNPLSDRRTKRTLWLLVLLEESPAHRGVPPYSRRLVASAHPDDDYNSENARTDLDRLDEAGYLTEKDERGMRGKILYELSPGDKDRWRHLVEDLGLSAEDFEEFLEMDPLSFDIMHHFAVQYLGTSVLPATPLDVEQVEEDLRGELEKVEYDAQRAHSLAKDLGDTQGNLIDEMEDHSKAINHLHDRTQPLTRLDDDIDEVISELQSEGQPPGGSETPPADEYVTASEVDGLVDHRLSAKGIEAATVGDQLTEFESRLQELEEAQEELTARQAQYEQTYPDGMESRVERIEKETGELWLMVTQALIWVVGQLSSVPSAKKKLQRIVPDDVSIRPRTDWYPSEMKEFTFTNYGDKDATGDYSETPDAGDSE